MPQKLAQPRGICRRELRERFDERRNRIGRGAGEPLEIGHIHFPRRLVSRDIRVDDPSGMVPVREAGDTADGDERDVADQAGDVDGLAQLRGKRQKCQ